MSLTKRWLETQPGAMCIAARIIEAESPLDWQDRQAAGRALAFALCDWLNWKASWTPTKRINA